ncbi:pilus assembly protein, PilO [Geobacter sp. OR-1]|uniref:type 4a pilus biogenesis protein PilO n=1 Tax=Geobacter sp. OR-1 TaxID=1266765 RepID=UPI000542B25C|nr:type 4a pilus biogenesis protein PilO [Geobacter sp. OR-1]GAM10651.1 pilus assembly protein, PilO [Geobacter sp. OR-1]
MNKTYFKEILRTRTRALTVLLSILMLNIVLTVFLNVYQKPKLATLQESWFNKRKTSGSVLDRGTAFDQGNADLQRWRSIIAPKKDLARIVGEIYEIAKSNSLSVGGITYKPEYVKSEKILSYLIGLTVNGKYAAVKSFISDISRMRDIITIDNISLNNPKLTEESVSLKLNLTIYLRPEGQ